MHWRAGPTNLRSAQHLTSAPRIPHQMQDLQLSRLRRTTRIPKHMPHSPIKFSELAVQLHLFTSERFHALFTLSSKYFSTFPHGTCSLSDSCMYLALDGVYHPLWAAFTNNPTPRSTQRNTDKSDSHPHGPFTLSGPSPVAILIAGLRVG